MVISHGVKRAEEHEACADLCCRELELPAREPAFAGGVVGDPGRAFSRVSLYPEAALAIIVGVSDSKSEDVLLARYCWDDLRQ